MTDLITEARNASLPDLIEILKEQRARRLDLVVPASHLNFENGLIDLQGLDWIENFEDIGDGNKMLLESYDPNGLYRPTSVFDQDLGSRLNVPVRLIRRLRLERPDLFDGLINGLLHGRKPKMARATREEHQAAEAAWANDAVPLPAEFTSWVNQDGQWWKVVREGIAADDRNFFLRTFRGDGEGVARSLLSDRFGTIDHLDGIAALMQGLEQAGIDRDKVTFDRLDLSERGMFARVSVPEISALAPELLKGYRDPFANGVERAAAAVRGRDIDEWRRVAQREGMGYTPEEGGEPVVFAGVGFSNSEVGQGGYSVWPEVVVQVCKNGLQLPAFKIVKRHVGAVMDAGVQWQGDTQAKNLELIVMQTRDLISQFLSVEFLNERVQELEELAGAPIERDTANDKIKAIGKKVGFTDDQVAGIIDMYLENGQRTAGGLANAVTAYSQTVESPDEAHDLDEKAFRVLQLAATGR